MKWLAIGLAAGALLVAVAAFAYVVATRGATGEAARVVLTTAAAAPAAAATPVLAPPARSVRRPAAKKKCAANGDNSDPTGSDRPSVRSSRACRASSDNQAGDRNSGDNGGDNQAGDGARGGA
jgi:hypothetical protein